jgi:hypothetical protein
MRLLVPGNVARGRMSRVQHSTFQKALRTNWHVADDGSVSAQSLMWFYCWAATGLNSEAAMEDCRRIWNEIVPVKFGELDSPAFHAFAREARKKPAWSDIEGPTLQAMELAARRNLPFLVQKSDGAAAEVSAEPPSSPAPQTYKTQAAADRPLSLTGSRLTPDELSQIHSLCRRTDERLWQVFRSSQSVSTAPADGLVFPGYRSGGGLRVSEQEARQLFCRELDSGHQFAYSVETPTERRYDGRSAAFVVPENGGMSARLDATLYRADRSRVLNVEFKAGSAGTSLGGAATKDLIKLLAEPCDGLWFAVLQTTSDSALRSVLATAWRTVVESASGGSISPNLPTVLVFHICVLDPAFSVHRVVCVPEKASENLITSQDFANFKWPGSAPVGGPRETETYGGWTLRQAQAV